MNNHRIAHKDYTHVLCITHIHTEVLAGLIIFFSILFGNVFAMNQIHDGQISQEFGLHYQDFDWNEFVEKLFRQPPSDPFTFQMSFLEQLTEGQLAQHLGIMLVNGARDKYHKELAELLPAEIEVMQKYFHSVGYEIKYQVESKEQFVKEFNKVMPVNYFQINFVPYPRINDIHNQPEKQTFF